MSKFFIHIRDRKVLYEDAEGVTVETADDLGPHIKEVVAELVDSEGPLVIDDPRVVEVTDESSRLVLSTPITAVLSKH